MPISVMPNLFIFRVGNESARKDLDVSIRQPIDPAVVLNAFGTDARQVLAEIEKRGPGSLSSVSEIASLVLLAEILKA